MPEQHSFDYAVVRIVPRVERGEFVNAGVILFSRTAAFLGCRMQLDASCLRALDGSIDAEVVEGYLDAIRRVCEGGAEAGTIGALSQSERFHWLTAPRSTVLQVSPVHSGVAADPAAALHHLFEKLVARPPHTSGP